LYPSSSAANAVDVDWVHGYIYFPQLLALGSAGSTQYTSPEGRAMTVTFTPHGDSNGTVSVTDTVRWVDEPRYNETVGSQGGNGSSATVPITNASGSLGYTSAVAANSSNQATVFMQAEGNDSMPWAFLDPVAYADHAGLPTNYSAYDPFGLFSHAGFAQTTALPDQLHRVWLFWSSTRNASNAAGTSTGAAGTAKSSSDLYYEALAPAFGATP
jgi:hypothetical protein